MTELLALPSDIVRSDILRTFLGMAAIDLSPQQVHACIPATHT